jgi:hypothetical protein
MALGLDMACGGADTWLRLPVAHDLAQDNQKADQLNIKRCTPVRT